MTEVEEWLKHYGFPSKVRFAEAGDEGFALSFGAGKRANSMVDMGFGLSQVLPLIVQGLEAPPFNRLIIEQPEIHLNPRLQARLADFLVEMTRRGLGVVVETHSEHFLLRLRRLVAEGRLDGDQVGIHFVEHSGGDSSVRKVPLHSSGYIAPGDWPRQFFDDALRESLALAQTQASRKRGSSG